MPSFMQLPLEIRREIYRHCLVAQGPINPHPATFGPPKYATDEANKPSVQLLRANKQIEAEAADVLYSENQWVVPVFHFPRNAAMIPNKYYARWRHVIIYIDYRNFDGATWAKVVALSHRMLPGQQSEARLADIHRRLQVFIAFEICMRCLSGPWDINRLHTLALDLEYTYCALGCCRLEIMEDQVFRVLFPLRPLPLNAVDKVQRILVRGLKSQEERDLACGTWGLIEA